MDKGFWDVFLKCDITAFNGNWAEKVMVMSHHLKKNKYIFICLPRLLLRDTQPVCSDGLSFSMLACQDIIQNHKQLIKILVFNRVQL